MALAILRVHSTNSFKHIFPWTWSFLLDLSSAESSGQACQGPGKFISSLPETSQPEYQTSQHGSTVLQQRLRGSI